MSKSEMLHEFYEQCKSIDFMETRELEERAHTEDEADFIRVISDFILQRRQRKIIEEKRF